MKCPFSFQPDPTMETHPALLISDCLKEDCQLYDPRGARCGILNIALELENISSRLSQLTSKISDK